MSEKSDHATWTIVVDSEHEQITATLQVKDKSKTHVWSGGEAGFLLEPLNEAMITMVGNSIGMDNLKKIIEKRIKNGDAPLTVDQFFTQTISKSLNSDKKLN